MPITHDLSFHDPRSVRVRSPRLSPRSKRPSVSYSETNAGSGCITSAFGWSARNWRSVSCTELTSVRLVPLSGPVTAVPVACRHQLPVRRVLEHRVERIHADQAEGLGLAADDRLEDAAGPAHVAVGHQDRLAADRVLHLVVIDDEADRPRLRLAVTLDADHDAVFVDRVGAARREDEMLGLLEHLISHEHVVGGDPDSQRRRAGRVPEPRASNLRTVKAARMPATIATSATRRNAQRQVCSAYAASRLLMRWLPGMGMMK